MAGGAHSYNDKAALHQAEPPRTRCDRCDGPINADGEHVLPSVHDEQEIVRRLALLALDSPLDCLLLLAKPISKMTLPDMAAGLQQVTGRTFSPPALHKRLKKLARRFPSLAFDLTPRSKMVNEPP